jgi:hypothetical protein
MKKFIALLAAAVLIVSMIGIVTVSAGLVLKENQVYMLVRLTHTKEKQAVQDTAC